MEDDQTMESGRRHGYHGSRMPAGSERSYSQHFLEFADPLMETLMNRTRILVLTLVSISLAASALAHHSPAVFDRTKEVKLVGVVKEFKWGNPHSWIELDVRNESGSVEGWSIEMNPPSYLVKAGWKSTT